MTHSVAWYDESQLLYVGVRIRGVGMQPELVSTRVGLTPTLTQPPTVKVERDLDGTDVDIDIPAEWIRETRTDPSPGMLLAQVDAALSELEASSASFRKLKNADECQFCIGILPGKNKRNSPDREEPLHEIDKRIDALGLTLSVRVVYPGMTTGIDAVSIRSADYWLEHAELRFIHVEFRGPTLSPASVTAALGLLPTDVTEPGVETYLDIDDTEMEQTFMGAWRRTVRTDSTPGTLVAQVESVLTELERSGDACRALRMAYDASFLLGISPATSELFRASGGELPSSIMRRLQVLGLIFSGLSTEFSVD